VPEHVYQFLIVLPNTDPLVWRRIRVPESYSFWDLHVAIQDAMGWQDRHLHEFTLLDSQTGQRTRIGIPDDESPSQSPCSAGWEVPIARYLELGTGSARYLYDFGDSWQHSLELEEIVPSDGGLYPRCLAGAGACPPEDVGGTLGYQEFVRILRDPRDPEHGAMLEWVGGSFDPDSFSADSIIFEDPRERWQIAFEDR